MNQIKSHFDKLEIIQYLYIWEIFDYNLLFFSIYYCLMLNPIYKDIDLDRYS